MLTVGALVLAVIAPALDSVEHGPETVTAPRGLPATPEPGERPQRGLHTRQLDLEQFVAAVSREIRLDASAVPGPVRAGLLHRRVSAQRASRTLPRVVVARPVNRLRSTSGGHRPAAVARETRTDRVRVPRPVLKRGAVRQRPVAVSTGFRGATERRLRTADDRGSMRAVVAYARSQVGKRYVRGGEGPYGFDCSGFTKRAYARAGYRLPHSSGAQARRARSVSRSVARPGDLVVGRGHVGIYMGDGMMIDAGNRRTGVVYRKVYRGLSVARLG
ncbi:C40 family peptidase [Actinoplanes flavus]|uniref:C40 family peptidase n=1 Tax=Actinoplanes flavus TaxID=2820290 RepID=UPI0027DDF9BA|nr:NlpC/P60 family protein [Actinoplanes flavus]